jgi:lipopolysaccharide/colanic/teichoic acid biosynthesis glycosyltransferase
LLQRLQSRGPLFYTQTRAGLQNRHFQIFKFRTMHVQQGGEARQATRGDGRIFPAGRWLRRFSIDEIPQFLNVLRGEMSVIGPRPHLVEHNALFAEQMVNYHVRTLVKPGITGLAQVRGFRGEARTSTEIAQRLASDISYLENWRLVLDVSIIARTAWQMVQPPRTAY